jgi:hypothetical protein
MVHVLFCFFEEFAISRIKRIILHVPRGLFAETIKACS